MNDSVQDWVGRLLPRHWVSEEMVRIGMISRGFKPQSVQADFDAIFVTAEKAGLVAFRPASLSKAGELGDNELPISTEARAKLRQLKRLFLTKAEEAASWKAPPPISLEEAARRHARQFGEPRTPPPTPDPVRQALIDAQRDLKTLRERDAEQSEIIEGLLQRIEDLEASPVVSGEAGRRSRRLRRSGGNADD